MISDSVSRGTVVDNPERFRPRVAFVTQAIDPSDPVLGFTAQWITSLAARCSHIAVIANEVRNLPDVFSAEVISLGKETGAGRFRRGFRYQLALARLQREGPLDALIAHMCPIYLTLAAPLTRFFGIRTLLWYAHPSNSRELAVAEKVADKIITSLPGSYPRPNTKVEIVGQAIDVARFRSSSTSQSERPVIFLALGRTSRSKGFTDIIRAMAIVCQQTQAVLEIIGPSTTDTEKQHRRKLVQLAENLGLKRVVHVRGGVPPSEIPDILHSCHVLINATVARSGDKAVFEAMAAGRPVLVSNPSFEQLLAGYREILMFEGRDIVDLAEKMLRLADMNPHERSDIGKELRARVEANHSIDGWSERVISLVAELANR